MDLKSYVIKYFTGSHFDDGRTFGCSADNISANGNAEMLSDAAWNIEVNGIVSGGKYAAALEEIQKKISDGFRPDAAIVFFAKNEFIERFLNRLSLIVGDIPIGGGGAVPAPGGGKGILIPHAEDVNVLLIKDARYIWRLDWLNVHGDTGCKINVRTASVRTILSIREEHSEKDIPAQAWFKKEIQDRKLPDGSFEHLAFLTTQGYNLHASPEGEFAIHTGSDIPYTGELRLGAVNIDKYERQIAEFCLADNSIVFGCAGLKSIVNIALPAGKNSLQAFLHGEVISCGRISPLFDIALGIDSELSGYDNIRLRGMLLGLSRSEIEGYMRDIVEFTELGDYLDIPVRTYSSGMMTRLTFAVATCFSPEILLMDEWIMAGDAAFLSKARHRVTSFVERASVLVLASHSPEICRQWCTKAVWMERGQVRMIGEIEPVLQAYSAATSVVTSLY